MSPPGRMSISLSEGRTSTSARSGTTFSPPIEVTGCRSNPTVTTERFPERLSSASAKAGSQSAKPANTRTCTDLLVKECSCIALADPCPFAGAASPHSYVIDQCSQNARCVSTLWIIQIVAGEWSTVFLEYPD